MIYKNWKIEPDYYWGYAAYDLGDCDAYILHANTVEQLKIEIDDQIIMSESNNPKRMEQHPCDNRSENE